MSIDDEPDILKRYQVPKLKFCTASQKSSCLLRSKRTRNAWRRRCLLPLDCLSRLVGNVAGKAHAVGERHAEQSRGWQSGCLDAPVTSTCRSASGQSSHVSGQYDARRRDRQQSSSRFLVVPQSSFSRSELMVILQSMLQIRLKRQADCQQPRRIMLGDGA